MAKKKLVTSRNKKEITHGSAIAGVLDVLLTDFETLTWVLGHQSEYKHAVLSGLSPTEWQAIQEEKRNRRAIQMLKKRKVLEEHTRGEQLVVQLSCDAIVASLKKRISLNQKALTKDAWCLVLFDFPVGSGTARQFWRRFLKMSGFTQIQLSVWGTRCDVAKDLQLLVKILGVSDWVKIYIGSEPMK